MKVFMLDSWGKVCTKALEPGAEPLILHNPLLPESFVLEVCKSTTIFQSKSVNSHRKAEFKYLKDEKS
jgi:hypothetical protein